MTSQSRSKVVAVSGLIAAAFVFSACDQSETPAPTVRSTPPALPTPSPAPVVEFSTPTATPSAPASRTATLPTEEPKPENPATLAERFRASTDPQERGDIVDELWTLDTPAAVETIRQLFQTEREADVKIDMIAGVTDSQNAATREGRFALVIAALTPGQPKDVREIAAQMLIEFEDPRALALLQQFAHDADPDIREAAREALETRKESEQQ